MDEQGWWSRVPWTIGVAACALVLIGLTGIARGDELTSGVEMFRRQVLWGLLGVPATAVAMIVPYRMLKPYSYALFLATLPLLVVVYFLPAVNGSHRWIPVGPVKLQPSELAKLTFILGMAHYLMYRKNTCRLTGLVVPFLVTLVPVGLVLKEPDLGTALLFFPVLFAMLYVAGARKVHLTLVVMMGLAVSPVLWSGMSAEQRSRIVSVFQQVDGGAAPRGDGYHLHQSKQLLALGGVWGSQLAGMPLDDPLAYHLPEGRTDFIYCLIGERWGLWGGLLTLAVYLVLFARGLAVAAATREPFGRLLAVGIVTLMASQAIINTGMTVGLMPITGMTLPLVSYGGSSLLATCVALGLLMNVGMRPGYEVGSDPFRLTPE